MDWRDNMEIKYNGLVNPSNLISFSDVPNILSVEDETGGTKANIHFVINDGFYSATTANTQWSITFMGNSVTNVLDPSNAINKYFYVAPDAHSTAASLCNALRACPNISAMFNIYLSTNESLYGHIVYLQAREIGKAWNDISQDLIMTSGLTTYISYTASNGTASSSLYNALINVDIYSNTDYITSLQKTYYDGCYFDVTPVLGAMSEIGNVKPYSMYVSYTNDSGITSSISSVTGNYASVGYQCNQGEDYLSATTGIEIAQNVSRGTDKSSYNNTILYVTSHQGAFPIPIYTLTSGTINYTVSYKDSAFNQISSTGLSQTLEAGKVLYTLGVPISLPNDCFYVDVTVGGKTLRYNVIKPANASYGKQRLYWRNSYGGVSFFDFTGENTLINEYEKETYNKNHLDYYAQPIKAKEKVYNTEVKHSYSVKTHLIEKDGTWSLYDLAQSPYVYTTINGVTYEVIVESVTVSEVNNQDIYECTIKFRISQPTSF